MSGSNELADGIVRHMRAVASLLRENGATAEVFRKTLHAFAASEAQLAGVDRQGFTSEANRIYTLMLAEISPAIADGRVPRSLFDSIPNKVHHTDPE